MRYTRQRLALIRQIFKLAFHHRLSNTEFHQIFKIKLVMRINSKFFSIKKIAKLKSILYFSDSCISSRYSLGISRKIFLPLLIRFKCVIFCLILCLDQDLNFLFKKSSSSIGTTVKWPTFP